MSFANISAMFFSTRDPGLRLLGDIRGKLHCLRIAHACHGHDALRLVHIDANYSLRTVRVNASLH